MVRWTLKRKGGREGGEVVGERGRGREGGREGKWWEKGEEGGRGSRVRTREE
jgi:hypothetical protein